MERLTGLDASFLYLETPNLHMHVSMAAVFDPSEGGAHTGPALHVSGFVQSTTTLPRSGPASDRATSSAASAGNARKTTSPHAAAAAGVAEEASLPHRASSAFTSVPSRAPNCTARPEVESREPRFPPTLPVPRIETLRLLMGSKS